MSGVVAESKSYRVDVSEKHRADELAGEALGEQRGPENHGEQHQEDRDEESRNPVGRAAKRLERDSSLALALWCGHLLASGNGVLEHYPGMEARGNWKVGVAQSGAEELPIRIERSILIEDR